jgi:hypothetical protein
MQLPSNGGLFWAALQDRSDRTDVGIVARAAIAEFGAGAVARMQARSHNHKFHGEQEGFEFWQSVAAAVREALSCH